jgi:hypothetical protein
MEFIKSWLCEDDHFQDDPKQLLEDFWKPIESDIAFQLLSGSSDSGAQRFRLPTRLIDVGYGDDISVSLRLSSEILNDNSSFRNHGERPDVRYVALSHSWGTLKFVNLTESSLSDFMHGISMGSLPLTFQDAISVVRRVGLRFLWIDSLCIIQDSGEDWRREAVRMKDIYSNAECVIAAAASWTSLDSFFVQQTPLAVNPCLLGVRGHLTDKKGNSPNSFSGIYALPALKYTLDSREDIRLSRLQSRAWCFQEEYLAKKIVYFGDHQVLLSKRRPSGAGVRSVRQAEWQSERETARDTFPDLIHPPIFKVTKSVLQEAIAPHALFRSVAEWNHRRRFHRSNRMANLLKKPIAPANRSDLDEGVYSASYLLTSRWWAVVVTNYSNRFLTRWEDKLQALSGVALRYQSQALSQGVEVHYVAGLWGDCNSYLVTGLLWYVSRHSRGPSLEQYRAPSWSWASVDGLVRNDSLSGCCSVDCAGISILQCSVEGPDVKEESQIEFPIGLCNGGFIVVRGMIQKAHWDILPEVDKRYYVEQAGRDLSIYDAMDLDELAPYSRDPMSGPEAYPLFSKSDVRVGYFLPDAKQGIPKEIFCLRIVVKPDSQAKQEDFSIPWATRGLALTTTGYGSNEFRRVGYFEIDKTLGGLSFLNKFSRSSNRRRAFRSPAPNIDLANFFSGCKEQEIVIR